MHIYVAIRGALAAIKEWENFMTSQYLPFEVLEKGTKKPLPYLARIQVREIKMYEIVCPKESEDAVMGMLKPTEGYGSMKRFIRPLKLVAKMLGLKKCSKTWKPNVLPNNDGMNVIALGTKDDVVNWTKQKSGNDCFDVGMPREML